ncbi:hypothetical protein ACHAXM_007360 [Skeletonema potamos]|jgi:hypothetical protein
MTILLSTGETLLLLLITNVSAFSLPSEYGAARSSRDAVRLHASTIENVQLKGGAEVKIGHRMQIGGLEADGDLTGLKMWPTTSEPMFRQLVDVILPAMHDDNTHGDGTCSSQPLRILEIGSGCGLLGISLAAYGEIVVLTDPAFPFRDTLRSDPEEHVDSITTLDHLQSNIDLNADILEGRATTAKLLWGDANDIEYIKNRGQYDLVIGSELLYYRDSFDALLETIRRLGVGGVPIILGYKTRRLGEQIFLDRAKEYFEIVTDGLGRKHEGLFLATCTLKE